MRAVDRETFDARFYWRQIRKHPWLILVLALVGLALGGLYLTRTQPVFRATAKLLIEREGRNVVPFDDFVQPGRTEAHYETQYQILRAAPWPAG